MTDKYISDEVCAPGINFLGGSCITIDLLEDMVKIYNADHSDKIVIPVSHKLNPITYKKNVVKLLSEKMKNYKCDTQTCWLTLPFFKKLSSHKNTKKLHNYTFRPKGPRNTNEWLNTFHINDVFSQYEKIYPTFKFFGAQPRNFDELPYIGIKDLNFGDLFDHKIYKIGFIFNLDRHDEPGSHWVSLYADLEKNQIYYFDSVGHQPEREFSVLMKRIENFCEMKCKIYKHCKFNTDVRFNHKQHQHGNSECGVYAISFILRMLDGENFDDIVETRVSDDEIQQCRMTYFR